MWNLRSSFFLLPATALVFGLSFSWASNSGAPKTLRCPGMVTEVTVTYRDGADADAACTGAGRAISFLKSHGLKAPDAVNVKIVDTVKRINGISMAAWFDPETRIVYVSSRELISAGQLEDDLFGLPIGHEIHASFFSHETAHAVIDHNSNGHNPSVAAHEYTAFVVQIATLPQAIRERALRGLAAEPYRSLAEVSDIYLAIAPNQFAAKAYLHFQATKNKGALLRRLVHDPRVVDPSAWY